MRTSVSADGRFVCRFDFLSSPLTDCFCVRSLIIFNPTEQLRTSVISVVVDSPDARVVDAQTGRPMAAQISAVWEEPTQASTESFQVKNTLLRCSVMSLNSHSPEMLFVIIIFCIITSS